MIFKSLARPIVCADGVRLSIQASADHYCIPKDDEGPYTHVEVGFPSITPPKEWMKYAQNPDTPTETVYGCIPVELVNKFVCEHGGVDFGKSL